MALGLYAMFTYRLTCYEQREFLTIQPHGANCRIQPTNLMGKVHWGTISNVNNYDRQGNWALTKPEHAGMGLHDLCT